MTDGSKAGLLTGAACTSRFPPAVLHPIPARRLSCPPSLRFSLLESGLSHSRNSRVLSSLLTLPCFSLYPQGKR